MFHLFEREREFVFVSHHGPLARSAIYHEFRRKNMRRGGWQGCVPISLCIGCYDNRERHVNIGGNRGEISHRSICHNIR